MTPLQQTPEPKSPDWNSRLPLTVGIAAILALAVGLGYWGTQANIAGAVVASGMIEVESNRQVIQHLEGGVVGEIFVKDGDRVEAGDVLIRLDGARQLSELTIVRGQLREIAARQARLQAERDGSSVIVFPPELIAAADTDIEAREQIDGERALFSARREALAQEINLLNEQNLQIGNRVKGVEAQLGGYSAQSGIVEKELIDQEALLAQRLTQSARVMELQREQADVIGQTGRLEAEIAELRGQAASNAIALLQLQTHRREDAVTTLRDLQFRQIELMERDTSLQETISRLEIRAPVSGIIYNSTVFAVQSVIRPADPLMYVIPQDQPLIVASRIETINIDEIHLGQEAVLRFSAFDQRSMPEMRGHLSQISADVLQDQATGRNYYLARILPVADEVNQLDNQVLLPGMPVEVFIQTGDRTAFQYLTQPMANFINRAFRE